MEVYGPGHQLPPVGLIALAIRARVALETAIERGAMVAREAGSPR